MVRLWWTKNKKKKKNETVLEKQRALLSLFSLDIYDLCSVSCGIYLYWHLLVGCAGWFGCMGIPKGQRGSFNVQPVGEEPPWTGFRFVSSTETVLTTVEFRLGIEPVSVCVWSKYCAALTRRVDGFSVLFARPMAFTRLGHSWFALDNKRDINAMSYEDEMPA